MSPRTGRPTDNPKETRIAIRLDKETQRILDAYCQEHGVSQAEAARRGIRKLADENKK